MILPETLHYDQNGLIPAILVDANSKNVLSLAYMNQQSLKISMEKKLVCLWSRAQNKLWLKGESTGDYLHIRSIVADCDRDSLVVTVDPDGPVCHLGTMSCFEYPVYGEQESREFSLNKLFSLMESRKKAPVDGSYTSHIFERGLNKILKLLGEETANVIVASKEEDHHTLVHDISDLIYHIFILMIEKQISLAEIKTSLSHRHILQHQHHRE